MKAFLKNYRQSPRKTRVVLNLLKGKTVLEAQNELAFLAKRAAGPIKKLLDSAVANTLKEKPFKLEDLYVVDARVDKGIVLKRWRPRAFGMAKRINKRSSHITIVVDKK